MEYLKKNNWRLATVDYLCIMLIILKLCNSLTWSWKYVLLAIWIRIFMILAIKVAYHFLYRKYGDLDEYEEKLKNKEK